MSQKITGYHMDWIISTQQIPFSLIPLVPGICWPQASEKFPRTLRTLYVPVQAKVTQRGLISQRASGCGPGAHGRVSALPVNLAIAKAESELLLRGPHYQWPGVHAAASYYPGLRGLRNPSFICSKQPFEWSWSRTWAARSGADQWELRGHSIPSAAGCISSLLWWVLASGDWNGPPLHCPKCRPGWSTAWLCSCGTPAWWRDLLRVRAPGFIQASVFISNSIVLRPKLTWGKAETLTSALSMDYSGRTTQLSVFNGD